MKQFDTVIVGAGLSGLVVGHELTKSGQTVLLIEKSNRCGGALRSVKKEGFLLEIGPNTVMAKPEILKLIDELRLNEKLVFAPPKSSRYIQFQNRLHRLPPGPLGVPHILRAICELFVKKNSLSEESVWSFFRRRFGETIADRIVSPFVSGIWAGDAKNLSVKSAFSQLVDWETQHGSVIKGLIKSHKRHAPHKEKGLISFRDGIETLSIELAQRLISNILTNTTVSRLEQNANKMWQITTHNNEIYQTKNIVFSSHTYETADILNSLSPITSNALKNIPYAPIKVLHLGFRRSDIEHPLKGFGYLTCPVESKQTLGCLWTSSLFSGRVPEGSVLITLFMGGMTNKNITIKDDSEAVNLALKDISGVLGIKNTPFFTNVTSYEKAIPQYTLGHDGRLQLLLDFQQANAGLWFSGNYIEGISVGDVIKNALKVAGQLQKSTRD